MMLCYVMLCHATNFERLTIATKDPYQTLSSWHHGPGFSHVLAGYGRGLPRHGRRGEERCVSKGRGLVKTCSTCFGEDRPATALHFEDTSLSCLSHCSCHRSSRASHTDEGLARHTVVPYLRLFPRRGLDFCYFLVIVDRQMLPPPILRSSL